MDSGMDSSMDRGAAFEKLRTDYAIAVEGRDDVAAVSRAADALIIPTHGYGISKETWDVLEKAYGEKGLIILTDPDHAGEQIRRRLKKSFPGAIHAFVASCDARAADDIGIENAEPEVIRKALETALRRAKGAGFGAAERACESAGADANALPLGRSGAYESAGAAANTEPAILPSELRELGLAGCEAAAEKRAAVCRELGIGYCNAGAMIKRLRGFGIDRDELREAVKAVEQTEIKKREGQEA